jgi:O-antigen/teichoic acid export membrane protein
MSNKSKFQWHTLLGRSCQFFLMVISIKVITSTISPYEYGAYGITMASIAIFSYILIGPLGLSINRNIYQWTAAGHLKMILIRFSWYSLLVAVLTALLIGLSYDGNLLGYFAIFFYMYSYTIAFTLIPNLNILGKTYEYHILLNFNLLLCIIFGYFFVIIFEQKYEYWLIGISLSNLISVFIALRVYINDIFPQNGEYKKIIFKKYFSFSGFMLINSIFTWIYLMGYRYIAGDELGYTELGIYMGCAAIAVGIISGFEQVVTGMYLPTFYKNVDNSSDAWLIYSKKIISSSIPVCLFIVINSELISRYVLPEEYQKHFVFIQYCAVAETFRVILSTFGYKLQGENKTYLMIIPSVLLALITNLIIFLNITEYGAIIIPIGMISSGILVLMLYILIIGNFRIDIMKIFAKFILITGIVAMVIIFSIQSLSITGVYKDIFTIIFSSIATGSIFKYALR